MEETPPSHRLNRCIRDLATLNALPSMCIGRSPEEVLEIVSDALPTALSCELVYLALHDGRARASLRSAPVVGDALSALSAALARGPDASGLIELELPERLWCLEVELPIGAVRGKLVAGRSTPTDLDTDRVLVRSAANLVGTALESANVLEAAKRKDEFLAMLGHELRNPLAPIVTAVDLLKQYPDAAREREVIERNTRHLARLVDDLLDISRVTCGHIELRKEQVALRTVLDRAIEVAAPLLSRRGQEFVLDSRIDAVLEGDPVRLTQVFGNLLTNAAKFTPQGGRIELSTALTGERVRVAVRDEGRGIAPEKLSLVFEPFVQIERITDSARGGLGLGLAIVKNLVERHGGSIVAHSDGPGKGATFVVELPAREAAAPEPARAFAAQAPEVYGASERRGIRVLIVDDNVDVAELLSLALEINGFETSVAHDAHNALASWRKFAPHAGVLDVGLPDTDGYELARALRSEHGTKPTLIAATGYGQPNDRQRSADAGFDCHLVKPVSIEDLVRVLDDRVAHASL
jgi:signal transduction histidine kinase/ActR/RegA family two-component response regulator